MNPFVAYTDGWRRATDFRGRTGRWPFAGFVIVVLPIGVMLGFVGEPNALGYTPLQAIWLVLNGLPQWALAARRMHDIGHSGWWVLLLLVPLLSILVWLALLFMKSDQENEWGVPRQLPRKSAETAPEVEAEP